MLFSLVSLQMAEGRKSQVNLLDDRKLEFLIQVRYSYNLSWQFFFVMSGGDKR
jgi:uncharacterized membrane protein